MNIKLKKLLPFSLVTGFMLLIAACGGPDSINSGSNNAGRVILNVGDSATCYAADSCKVYLIMPEATGSYVVKQRGPNGDWTAGTFPADGQTVLLGEFTSGRTEFTIEGMDFPSTWVSVMSVTE